MKKFILKPRINKRNGQININLPKKKIPKEVLKKIFEMEKIKLYLED